ncbi:MAG: glycosyltransferase [Myxococcales bacterium]|nr:glycosyltransferase [Myxococcales bacterium]
MAPDAGSGAPAGAAAGAAAGVTAGATGVIHVAHALDGFEGGGVGRYVRALAGAQAALGLSAIAVSSADLGPACSGFRATWDQPTRASRLAGLVSGAGPRPVVHVHHFSGLGFGAVAAVRAAGARVVVTTHDYWIDCPRGQRVDRRSQVCAGPEPERCASCLRPDGLPGPLGRGRVRERMSAVRRLDPDLWLTVAEHLCAGAELVDLPLLQLPAVPLPHDGPVRFLFVGTLIPSKGVDLAVEAFRALPAGAATLDVVGPTPAWHGSTRFLEQLRTRASPGITLHPPGDTRPWYARSDVLLFPSRWDEGCPLVLREAASCGLHVLSSDVPGARRALGDYPAVWLPSGPPQGALGGPPLTDWVLALSKCVRGVLRHPPARFPTLEAHAAALIERYAELVRPR